MSEGKVVARATAERLDYRRAAGRMVASRPGGMVYPAPGSSLAQYGTIRFLARDAEGEVLNRRGSAWGNVRVDTARGDTALTERIDCDGDFLRSSVPVAARGPGYQVDASGLSARTDGTDIRLTSGVKGQLRMEARR